jgi:ATP-binding protein involved in chromosome partitioning
VITLADIRERLEEVRPPGVAKDIVTLGLVQGIAYRDGNVTIELRTPTVPEQSLQATLADIRRVVGALDGVREVEVRLQPPTDTGPAAGGANPFADQGPVPGVRDIIAVASTKGGVGKSTVAVNLALALRHTGRRIGLLDADVYGPSLPIMFNLSERPRVSDDKRVFPLEKDGLVLMSVGFFLDDSSPVIWRGPLVMGLIRQFLKDVEWGTLDLLVVDMPPGTGDAQLTLVQQVPLAGVVVVTTPQEVATLDVQRGIAMFQQVNTPVLGIVENMSYYECPECGEREDIFGSGGGKHLAETVGVPLLGQIPLVPAVRAAGDQGRPIVIDQPDHPVSRIFAQIAHAALEAIEAERLTRTPPTIIA